MSFFIFRRPIARVRVCFRAKCEQGAIGAVRNAERLAKRRTEPRCGNPGRRRAHWWLHRLVGKVTFCIHTVRKPVVERLAKGCIMY